MSGCLVLASGGLDSTVALYLACREYGRTNTLALNMWYGSKHNAREREAFRRTTSYLGCRSREINLNDILAGQDALTGIHVPIPEGHYTDDSMKSTVVPNRNMVLLSIAAVVAIRNDIDTIWYGAHAGDHAIYPDCRKEFITAMGVVMGLCHYHPIKLEAPFASFTKGDIVATGRELGVDWENTWTCYKGGGSPCGKCGSCVERREAFDQNKMEDPLC